MTIRLSHPPAGADLSQIGPSEWSAPRPNVLVWGVVGQKYLRHWYLAGITVILGLYVSQPLSELQGMGGSDL